jgi:MoaA/NifB/PqqE/SkfB family radical SAM enzyme/SAM-dependent methyltransferase
MNAPPRLRGIPSEEEAAVALSEGKLLVIGIMTSRRCNLRCSYCYTDAGHARAGEIEHSERLRVIREASDLGARLLWIPGEGEPLLDRGPLWELLETAQRLGLWTLFYTSGALITREDAKRISAYPCSVVIKLNSLEAAVQDRIAGVLGTSQRIRRGLEYLIEEGLADQGRLGAETVILPENLEEIPEIFRFCRQRKLIPYIERLLPAGRGADHALHLSPAQEDQVFRTLANMDREEFGFEWEPKGTFAAGLWTCDRILYTLVVDAIGLVHPCVAICDTFGDVRRHSLDQIWNGARLTAFRRSLSLLTGRGRCFCHESLANAKTRLEIHQPRASKSGVQLGAPTSQPATEPQPQPRGIKYLRYTQEEARIYDEAVWALVPGYGPMLDAIAAYLGRSEVKGNILDLGAGTGTLAERLLRAAPRASFELIDFSPAMCRRATEKLTAWQQRCIVQTLDITALSDYSRHCVIVSTLALHEITPPVEQRWILLRKILTGLPQGGLLLVGDYYRPASESQRGEFARAIREHAAARGWPSEDVEREIEEHLFDPTIPTIEEELASVARWSGTTPRMLLRHLNLAVWLVIHAADQSGEATGSAARGL